MRHEQFSKSLRPYTRETPIGPSSPKMQGTISGSQKSSHIEPDAAPQLHPNLERGRCSLRRPGSSQLVTLQESSPALEGRLARGYKCRPADASFLETGTRGDRTSVPAHRSVFLLPETVSCHSSDEVVCSGDVALGK